MDKRDLSLLERAYEAEISSALEGSPRLMQSKSARAHALVAEGLLNKCVEVWRGVKIEGYELTHAGRFTYCAICGDATQAEQAS